MIITLTKQMPDSHNNTGQGSAETEITPQMVEAGYDVLMGYFGLDLMVEREGREAVAKVYRAMASKREKQLKSQLSR